MKRKYSTSKKIISASLAYLLLLNTACSGQWQNSAGGQSSPVKSVFQNFLNSETVDDNKALPDGYDYTRGENGTEEHDFYYTSDEVGDDQDGGAARRFPSSLPEIHAEMHKDGENLDSLREYAAGHGERMAEVHEICRSIGCQGIEGIDDSDGILDEARRFIRADDSHIPRARRSELKTLEDVRQELDRIERELIDEKSTLEKANESTKENEAKLIQEQRNLSENVQRSADNALKESQEQIENAKLVRDELIEAHNSGVDRIYDVLGIDKAPQTPADGQQIAFGHAPSSEELNRFKRINGSLRTTANLPALNDSADILAELAQRSAQRGDMASYDLRMDAARVFAWASQHKGPHDSETLTAATSMSSAAQSLDDEGLFSLSNEAVALAKKLVPFALGFARMSDLIDVPMNLMEAFSGKTLDFDEDAKAFVRDCTTVERAFAVGALALGTIGVFTGSAPVFAAAVAAGGAGKILKAFKRNSQVVHGAESGEKLFEETVTVAKALDRAAPGIMAQGVMTPYAKRHIWHGNIRISHDKLKIRIDGGLHTQEGLRSYLEMAPAHNAPVSREMLSNGVERVVFPDSALTGREIDKLKKSAEYGFGVPNGKTIFPSNWTPEKIESAVNKAVTEGKIVAKDQKGFKKEIVHEGVTVIVNFGNDGKPNSAFPKWIQ
jgi:hypothetical protein